MIYGMLLAAGTSSRMGQPKQLLDWQGQPLVRHVAQQALASSLEGLVVVVGAAAEAVSGALDGLGAQIVTNPDYAAGQAGSLRVGLAALPDTTTAAVVLLVDQPLITPALINQIVQAFQTPHSASPLPLAVIPRYRGQRGNPVLLARPLFAELTGLQGDVGARKVLQRYADQLVWLDLDDPAVVTDIDTPEAYRQLQQPT